MNLKEQFCQMLYEELLQFQRTEFRGKSPTRCRDLYELLSAVADGMSDPLLYMLVERSAGILAHMYGDFSKDEASFREAIERHGEEEGFWEAYLGDERMWAQ